MKKLLLVLFSLLFIPLFGQKINQEVKKLDVSAPVSVPFGGARLPIEVHGKDTLYLASLREVVVYAPVVFKSKKEERFYWRTVRDVKKALPYAKIVSAELIGTNNLLAGMKDDKERKAYLEQYEKDLFKKYEKDMRNMTFSQGKMLLKLIDREVDRTSYDLIKHYRGGFSAFFWQGIAKIFGADLKSSYDTTKDEDRIIERVIALVEAGQL